MGIDMQGKGRFHMTKNTEENSLSSGIFVQILDGLGMN